MFSCAISEEFRMHLKKKRIRISHGKRATDVRVIEVLLQYVNAFGAKFQTTFVVYFLLISNYRLETSLCENVKDLCQTV